MEFTDATTGKKQTGVAIEIAERASPENSFRSFIDYEEVESLLRGIDYISKATRDVTKLDEFEATYRTKGYFSATAYSSSDELNAVVKSGYIRLATAHLSVQQLGELRGMIAEAKQKLDSVK
jgi:hypothetical protein